MARPPGNDPYDWQRTISESVEEMLRLVDEAEDYIYDYVFPSLLKSKGPEAEREFFQQLAIGMPTSNGGVLNWQGLHQLSPKLFQKYSDRALTLEEQQRQAAAKAMDELGYQEYQQARQFRPQLNTPPIFGMRPPGGVANTTQAAGLDIPLGVLGSGP